jgi:adenosylmethionine-8-amino-7-oxononanoate aminotransferase
LTSFGVSLLSGGLDSTTVTAYARDRVDHLTSLTFHYGQVHSKEVDCAAQVAAIMGVENKLVNISFLGEVAWYSALTSPESFPIPKEGSEDEIGNAIPITYVPMRNTIFLALSAAFIESRVLHAIEVEGLKPADAGALLYMAPNPGLTILDNARSRDRAVRASRRQLCSSARRECMVSTFETETLRQASLKYLWMQNRDWVRMGEEGEPLIMVDGDGVRVTDSQGKTWVDVNGGYISVNVGYGRTEIARAAYEQMLKITDFPAGSTTIPAIKLAEKLSEITPGSLSRVFLVSGGSEANETALKITRAYHSRRGEPGRYKVISRKGSYHGTTGGVLWLGESPTSPRTDYEPMYPGMLHAPQPNPYRCELDGETASECAVRCATAIEDLIVSHGAETVAAVIGEPVATPQGAVVPGDEYWPMLRQICDKHGVLLIADEVISGFGRTGKMFAIEHWDVVPDIMTVSKGIISSYLPLGATIVRKEVADYFGGQDNHLRHVLSFAGHPVSAAAALKNIEILENEGMVEKSAETGAYFKKQLEGLKLDHPIVGDVRGVGLLVAVELVRDRSTKARFPREAKIPAQLTRKFREQGLIFRVNSEILSIGPPLCITRKEVDQIVHAIDRSLGELEGELGIAAER